MADLHALIRFRKHTVDEKQRVVARLYREAEEIEQRKQNILNQIEKEREQAEEMQIPFVMTYYGLYVDGARKKIKGLDRALEKVNARIETAREDLREAFAELKKVEITQRKREEEEDAEEKRRETQILDDIGIDSYRRKLNEE